MFPAAVSPWCEPSQGVWTSSQGENADQNHGIGITRRAMEEPLRQIAANAGAEASVVLNKVLSGKGNFGFNAATEKYGDLVAMGILDPTKVVRIGASECGFDRRSDDYHRSHGGGSA